MQSCPTVLAGLQVLGKLCGIGHSCLPCRDSELLISPGGWTTEAENDLTHVPVFAIVPWSWYQEIVSSEAGVTSRNVVVSKRLRRRWASGSFLELCDAERRTTGSSKVYDTSRLSARPRRHPGRHECPMPHTFPNIWNAAEFVGQTPWSARVPLDPLFGRRIKWLPARKAGQGAGCGRGRPPHNPCRCSVMGKLCGIGHSCLPCRD